MRAIEARSTRNCPLDRENVIAHGGFARETLVSAGQVFSPSYVCPAV
jgi:hypothetical protein